MVSDRGIHFVNGVIKELTDITLNIDSLHRITHVLMVKLKKTKGILCKIIIEIVQNSMIDWDSKLLDVLWAYHIAYKVTTKFTLFQLVYGQEAILLVKLKLPSSRIPIDEKLGEDESLQERIVMLENTKSSLFKWII